MNGGDQQVVAKKKRSNSKTYMKSVKVGTRELYEERKEAEDLRLGRGEIHDASQSEVMHLAVAKFSRNLGIRACNRNTAFLIHIPHYIEYHFFQSIRVRS